MGLWDRFHFYRCSSKLKLYWKLGELLLLVGNPSIGAGVTPTGCHLSWILHSVGFVLNSDSNVKCLLSDGKSSQSLTCSRYSACSSCAPSWQTAASWPCPSRSTGPNTWSKYTWELFFLLHRNLHLIDDITGYACLSSHSSYCKVIRGNREMLVCLCVSRLN